MATDTAFVLGLMALLGKKHVPGTAKIFLVGIAIVDDIGAVLVIALFYTDAINIQQLFFAGICYSLLILSNYTGIRNILTYIFLGILFWLFIYQAGIHGTVAGVMIALTIPARPHKRTSKFTKDTRNLINKLENNSKPMLESEKKHEYVETIEQKAIAVTTPLQRWESALQNPVNLLIIPLFAFFNAGITINTERIQTAMDSPILIAIILGLLVGKPLGIIIFTLACVRSRFGSLSDNLNLHHIISLGILAGMGFTMSIFIATLAFDTNDLLNISKLGILLATTVAGVSGMAWMLYASRYSKRSRSRDK
jgi:NhaA family Na+:H+ antiporter